jgi:hypothetical protein
MNNNTKIDSIEEKLNVNKMLMVKLQGPKDDVIDFIRFMKSLIPQDHMNLSPILKNNESSEIVHCFVNVMLPYEPIDSAVQRLRGETNDREQG